MKYKNKLALLVSILTISGCTISKPQTYGVPDLQWEKMSPAERLTTQQNYEKRMGNVIIARKDNNKNQRHAHSNMPSDNLTVKNNESAPTSLESNNLTTQIVNDQHIDSDSSDNSKISRIDDQHSIHSESYSPHNENNTKLHPTPIKSNDIVADELTKGGQLIMNLRNQLGRQPLLGEMQNELQQNMGVSSRKARRIIEALGLY